MDWKPAESIAFSEGGGTFADTPIGAVKITFGMNATVYASVTAPDGKYERFELTPQRMLEGLMQIKGVDPPSANGQA